ncbi:hypothetical protein ACHAQI_005546 [Fusarium lateritium]
MKPWENEPIMLPDGRLVCSPHRLVVCGQCTVDYSYMDKVLEDLAKADEEWKKQEAEEEALEEKFGPFPQDVLMDMHPTRRGHGRVLPTEFRAPPSETPQSLFPVGVSRQAIPPVTRFIHRDDPKCLLIYIHGSCLRNGQEDSQGGWACLFRPLATNIQSSVSGRLEHRGPTSDIHWQSSDRAELRAVIGALRFRHWRGEGFTRLVLATNSEHVVKGGTEWARNWCLRGWRTSSGRAPKNRDMWEAFFGELERLAEHGLKVQLWKTPKSLNKDAEKLAKEATREDELDDYVDVLGTLC